MAGFLIYFCLQNVHDLFLNHFYIFVFFFQFVCQLLHVRMFFLRVFDRVLRWTHFAQFVLFLDVRFLNDSCVLSRLSKPTEHLRVNAWFGGSATKQRK